MDKTIATLNRLIGERVARKFGITDVRVFGLAEPVLVRDSESDTTSPAIVNADGECHVVYDSLDCSRVTIYGRLQSISYETNASQAFGNGKGYEQVADASVVLIGSRQINPYALEKIVADAIGTSDGLQLTSADFNAVQVWGSEFPGVPYFINPDYFLFKVNYKLSTSTDLRCNKQ